MNKHRPQPTALTPDLDWIRERQRLVRQMKSEALKWAGPEPRDLRVLREKYESAFKKVWKVSNKSELLSEVEAADIVYGGDFHAIGQAQRTHLRILRDLSGERPVVIALECFGTDSQKWLDAYLRNEISAEDLKVKVRWAQSWGFSWESYRPLIEIAKRRGFGLLALNLPLKSRQHGDIEAREEHAAEKIRDLHLRKPDALIYVVFGDLHLTSEQLPKVVRNSFSNPGGIRDVIIHLNSERVYFQLARQGLELSVDVVRLPKRHFCVLSSPPWVQWQSYLLHLEQTEDLVLEADDDDDDDVDYDYDPTDQVINLIRLCAGDLGIQDLKFDDISISLGEDNRSWEAIERGLKAGEKQIARHLLASGRSFFIPASGTGLMAQASINNAATLAGQYLHARLSGQKRPLWQMPGDFSALIWSEAVSYFASKLINHKKRAQTLTDLRAQIAMSGGPDHEKEAMRLALDRSMSELILFRQGRLRKERVRPRRKTSYLEAARILGGMLGERLYMAYRSRKMDKKEIVQLMKRSMTARGFAKEYELILRKIAQTGAGPIHAKSKRERL